MSAMKIKHDRHHKEKEKETTSTLLRGFSELQPPPRPPTRSCWGCWLLRTRGFSLDLDHLMGRGPRNLLEPGGRVPDWWVSRGVPGYAAGSRCGHTRMRVLHTPDCVRPRLQGRVHSPFSRPGLPPGQLTRPPLNCKEGAAGQDAANAQGSPHYTG